MTDRMPPGWENAVLGRLLGPPGRDGPVTCRLVTGTPRAEGPREPCDHEDGLRKCCGTRQLGPHAGDCRLSPPARDGMAGHERMYSHGTEHAPEPGGEARRTALYGTCEGCGAARDVRVTEAYAGSSLAELFCPGCGRTDG